MARITVEDCIDKFPSRFELVLVASQRARKLHSGDEPTVAKDNDKNTVISLREIAESTISVEDMKENLIQEYQTVSISDEENENLELENADKILSNEIVSESSKEVEEEMKDLVNLEEREIEEQYEIKENDEDVPVQEDEEIQAESNIDEDVPVQEDEEIQAESNI